MCGEQKEEPGHLSFALGPRRNELAPCETCGKEGLWSVRKRVRCWRREAVKRGLAFGVQEPLGGSRTHRQKLMELLLVQLEAATALQIREQEREKGNQAFGADVASGSPGYE